MTGIVFHPLWGIDIIGCLLMVFLSLLCMRQVLVLYKLDRENPLNTYLLWLISALFVFCLLRSVGHLVKYLLLWSNHQSLWAVLAPWSGGLNSATFIVIFAVTLFFRDVLVFMNRMTSDRAKIEASSRQLLSLNQEVESVVSDRTKVEMALNLAHEIRNPVMIISGLLKRLRRTAVDELQSDAQYHREIKQQIDQLERLVEKFENMQIGTRDHFQAVDLNRVLSETVEMVREEAINKKIELSFTPSPDTPHCHGDRQYLSAAFLHLLRNGVEACRGGDSIIIRADVVDAGIFVHIHDSGPGIPKQILSHIFEPFYSTRDGATGIGLSYVRQIIEEHRGRISLDSTVGRGTRVEVFIPFLLGQAG